MTTDPDLTGQGKGGFRNLRVVAKTVESSLITSFHLEAADGSGLPAFRPGQFLVFKIPSGDAKGHVLRNYSLSGSPDDPGQYRISVKREPSAGPGLPVGLSSNYLHDSVGVGDVLAADGPRGEFVLDEASDRPVVLLSGGVGLTPMVAMLHGLAHRSARRTLFLHACENGEVHALRDEVNGLTRQRPGLSAHYCYRVPSTEDRAANRFDSEGFITRELMQSLLCLDRARESPIDRQDSLDRDRRSDIATGVTTHAVGNHKKVGAGVAAVLVVRTNLADVRYSRALTYRGHPPTAAVRNSLCRS